MRAVAEGLRFIAVRPVLVMSFAVDIAAMVLAMPRSLFPAVADERFGGQVGPLYAAIAIGAVVAGLSSGWIGRVRRAGPRADVGHRRLGRRGRRVRPGRPAVAGRRPARPGRRVRPRQRGLPADHPPDLRAGRDARADAGGVHRRRRGRPTPRRRPGGRHRGRDQPDFSWVAGGVACMAVVIVAGLLVRPFWRYDTSRDLPSTAHGLRYSRGLGLRYAGQRGLRRA